MHHFPPFFPLSYPLGIFFQCLGLSYKSLLVHSHLSLFSLSFGHYVSCFLDARSFPPSLSLAFSPLHFAIPLFSFLLSDIGSSSYGCTIWDLSLKTEALLSFYDERCYISLGVYIELRRTRKTMLRLRRLRTY